MMFEASKFEVPVEYFRGVDFHLLVLKNKAEIRKLIPNILKEGHLGQLESLQDCIQLGQLMIYAEILTKTIKHPNLIV